MSADSGHDNPHEPIITQELSRYRPRRSQRYSAVNVLVVTWKDDDIGVASEAADFVDLLRQKFSFLVWPYQIPSGNSQSELQVHVAQFIKQCGSDGDALIILYYSGHGGQTLDRTSSECVWAAKGAGGPTLDWSIVQPLFLGANCDVAILLDCCFSGQAVRSQLSHNVEFLAATDKDQFVPTGKLMNRPSFTRVLMQELSRAQRETESLTISELHRNMLRKEHGLVKQPFYVKLAQSRAGVGIRLAKWELENISSSSPSPSSSHVASLCLRLSLFHPLDLEKRNTLLRWMTRDSPADIEDIELVHQTILDARSVGHIGRQVLQQEVAKPQSYSDATSIYVQEEAGQLINALNESLHAPEACQFDEIDVREIVNKIREKSEKLLTFLKDNLSTLNKTGLETVLPQNMATFEDLRSRVAMRLVLIQNEVPVETCKVYFESPAPTDQHIWFGKKDDQSVLVEYWHYEASDRDISTLSAQAARVSALLSENKDDGFRTLPGLGFTHETIRKRFGFIYQLPAGVKEGDFCTLAALIGTLKNMPLEIRTRLATAICDSLLHLHSIGWYHKAIKSENVLLLRKPEKVAETSEKHLHYDLESPYVIGFDCSRPSEAETWVSVDFSKGNLYRHPERWGSPKRFKQHHDIYAMGILLLEIGCWRLLPNMDGRRKNFEDVKNPERLRDTMITLCESKLAHAAGSRYSEAAMTCLRKRNWEDMEPWQIQRFVREHVWQPLKQQGQKI